MLTFALALLLTVTISGGSALALTRSEVIARAIAWTDKHVPYSQARTFMGYRTDCSGFVSYALGLGKPGETTNTLWNRTWSLRKEELQPGDVMLAKDRHVVLFAGWANSDHTKYVAYEQASSVGSVCRVIPYPYYNGSGRYVPRRCRGISGSAVGVSRGGAREPNRFRRAGMPLRVMFTRQQSDFSGDGASDLSFIYDGWGDKRSLWRFYSSKSSFKAANVWTSTQGTFEVARTKQASGDFNGDKIADTAVFYRNSDNSTAVWVFYSRQGKAPLSARVWTGKPGAFDWEHMKMVSGDYNGDGRYDLAFFYGPQGNRDAIWVFLTKKSGGFSTAKWWSSKPGGFSLDRAKLASGDFNGDGLSDIAILYNYVTGPSAMWVFAAKQKGGFQEARWWKAGSSTFQFSRVKMVTGYFNRDDKADLGVFYNEPNGSSSLIAFTSNGSNKFSPRQMWHSSVGGFLWDRAKIMSGDFNGDGLSDMTFLYEYSDGHCALLTFLNDAGTGLKQRNWWSGTPGGYSWSLANPANQDLAEGGVIQ